MARTVRLEGLDDPRLDAYARLTEHQLRSRLEPERAMLVAESRNVIDVALAQGLEPLSFLVDESHLASAADLFARAPEEVPVFVLPQEQLDQVLPETEILVMALPSVADTVGILSRERIALLPRDAIVVNVGRGTSIDQEALMEALNAGRIAGAALDVAVPEPLPREHPLWSTRNLLLTPHISGNMSLGYTCDINVDMFCRDLENYAAGRPLEHRVDRKRGY